LPFCHFKLKAEKPIPYNYPKVLKTLGDHIRKKRLDLGLFQKDLAKLIGVDKTSVYNWENNKTHPAPRFFQKIVHFLEYRSIIGNPKVY
jgi:DNA-binding XRE family transcriptional regulator